MLGTAWYAGMSTPKNGLMNTSGAHQGGHAYLLIGYDDTRRVALIQNSWGLDWGVEGGRARISYDDLHRLLLSGGEACIATEV